MTAKIDTCQNYPCAEIKSTREKHFLSMQGPPQWPACATPRAEPNLISVLIKEMLQKHNFSFEEWYWVVCNL